MKTSQLFAVTALALAAGAALADDAQGAPLTRAEVAQSVLAARAAGALIPAGEGDVSGHAYVGGSTSSLTRAQEKAEVLQARAEGTLAHAGSPAPEEDVLYARAHPSTSILTRAQVKADVLEARANGELIPAGQGEFSDNDPAVHMARANTGSSHRLASRAAN